MPFAEEVCASPNFDVSPRHECVGVVFHHSVCSYEQTIDLMRRAESKVSYHVLIHPAGKRCQLVRDDCIAWHAGASEFFGRRRCNDFMLGVAFAGDTYASPLTQEQIASALEWLEARWTTNRWALDRMTDHRQVAPGRKDDLNPAEWERLRTAIASRFGAAAH